MSVDPSVYLIVECDARGWSADRFARELGVNHEIGLRVLLGNRHIDQDMAERIGRAFGTSAEVWNNLAAAFLEAKLQESWQEESHVWTQT